MFTAYIITSDTKATIFIYVNDLLWPANCSQNGSSSLKN